MFTIAALFCGGQDRVWRNCETGVTHIRRELEETVIIIATTSTMVVVIFVSLQCLYYASTDCCGSLVILCYYFSLSCTFRMHALHLVSLYLSLLVSFSMVCSLIQRFIWWEYTEYRLLNAIFSMPRTCYNAQICFLSLYVIIIQLQSIHTYMYICAQLFFIEQTHFWRIIVQ